MVESCSDHSRIVPALEMTFHLFSANFCQMLGGHFLCGRRSILVSSDRDTVAPRIVNDVSYVTTIKHASHSVWQALDGDPCCSARVNDVPYVTKMKHASHSVWQARCLVRLEGDTCFSVTMMFHM